MKIQRFILLAGLLSSSAFAQTNTFPSSGFTGIGTTAPISSLHIVAGNTDADHWLGVFSPGPDSNGFRKELILGYHGGEDYAYIQGHHQNVRWSNLVLQRYEGNVGIGTTAPGARLHVMGYGNANLGTIRLDSGNVFTSVTSRQWDFTNEPEGFTSFSTSYDSSSNNLSIGGGLDEFNAATNLYFYTGTSTSQRTGSIKMSINSSGNVGIGTTTPEERLTVAGNLKLGTNSDSRGLNLVQNYMALGETEHGATTIIGNNIKVTNGAQNTLQVSANSDDGSNWLGIGYYHGFTFNHIGPTPIGTQVNEHTGELMRIAINGNVGIGTTNPQHKLAVNGTIKAKEVIVETTGWSDYVFADDYKLAPLSEVEAHIKANKHLPGIPSAAQVAEKGVNVGDVQAALLAKIEEITLHQIAQQKELASLKAENAALKNRVYQLETR